MATAASLQATHDALLPRPAGGTAPGLALALLVHGGLLAALSVSVDWRTREPDVVSAELWAAVPQTAAPRPAEVAPPPPAPAPAPAPKPPAPAPAPPPPAAADTRPTEADIAIEREQRRKLEAARKKAEADAQAERERVAEDKAKKAEAEKKKREMAAREAAEAQAAKEAAAKAAAAADERIARQREENLKRMMGDAGAATPGTGRAGTAAQDAAPSASYIGRLVALIRPNVVFTGAINNDAAAEVEVRSAPAGTIISSRLVKSSGHKDWDDAVLRAVEKTGRLPTDASGRVPSPLILVFRPRE